MKTLFLILLIIVLACSLIISSCAQSAPGSVPGSPTASAEPIKLKLAHPAPPVTVFHKAIFEPWAKMIKERTTAIGKPVEISIFPGGSLAKHDDQYKAVQTGITDIGPMITTEDFVGGGGLVSVMELPLQFSSSTIAAQVAQELYDTIPEVKDETSNVKLLWFHPTGPGHIQASTKQIKTLEDMQGQKVWCKGGGITIDILEALGAVPVGMPITEGYIALERGIMDIGLVQWEGAFSFKWYEVTKYRTSLPRGLWLDLLSATMNWDSWNSLPPDVQEIFEELSGEYMSILSGEAFDEADMHCCDLIMEYDKEVGNPEIYSLPEDEFLRWKEALNPVYEKWIKDMEDKGLPGREVYETTCSLIEKYSK